MSNREKDGAEQELENLRAGLNAEEGSRIYVNDFGDGEDFSNRFFIYK